MNQELTLAQTALRAVGCDFALLSSIHNVTYISGFEVPIPVGAGAETAYGPSLALCAAGGEGSWLITSASNGGAARAQSRLSKTLIFGNFDSFAPLDSKQQFLEQTRAALAEAGLRNTPATLGIEARSTPYAVVDLLMREFPHLKLIDVDDAMAHARQIKTQREIGLLRRAAQICAIGHQTLAELVQQAGRTEFEMWAELCQRMFRAVGHEVPVTGELVTGPRTCTVNYPGGPRERTTLPGDAALMDISQRVDGYWSDCTNTHVIGGIEPTAHQKKYARASQAAFEACVAMLRPGVRASEAWQAANTAYEKHGIAMPHYMGHQIGAVVNELPRLVPYDHTVIQAGMVFAVEPGAYEGEGGTFGARSEKMIVVTDAGPEVLAEFDWGI
ncbi:MAG: aminopeptidase P family protein [Anaerolineae bacterium]|nr:aminopeptidase P family protein [Anaerolineae bacterium]